MYRCTWRFKREKLIDTAINDLYTLHAQLHRYAGDNPFKVLRGESEGLLLVIDALLHMTIGMFEHNVSDLGTPCSRHYVNPA